MSVVLQQVATAIALLAAVVGTVVLVRAFDSRRMGGLRVWHRALAERSPRTGRSGEIGFDEYLRREDDLFRELDERVHRGAGRSAGETLNRFVPGSVSCPSRYEPNWNRSFQMVPPQVRGSVLLLHGLTDSPYSVRRLARLFYDHGFHALALRMPGHGTAPSSLRSVRWKDWAAAVRVGSRHLRDRLGVGPPFHVVGYSNGGALALNYAIEALDDATLTSPTRLFLLSPEIGVTAFARLANWHRVLSWLPYFEKFQWQSILPEYDPYKYNSFPKHAGYQVHLLTRRVRRGLASLERARRIDELPPMLTFQSVVDTTVVAREIVTQLYDRLDGEGHELVLYDINRLGAMRELLRGGRDGLLAEIEDQSARRYALRVVTNASDETLDVVERLRPPQGRFGADRPLGLRWPENVYSQSHVSLPFSPDDPFYGAIAPKSGFRLGALQPRGEKDLLSVPVGQLMRLRHNPFFAHVEERILETLTGD